MEMTSVNDNVPQKQTTVEPSLLSLRHVDNVIPTVNRCKANASGIILVITGLLGVICIIVLAVRLEETHSSYLYSYSATSSAAIIMQALNGIDKLWLFPYLVSE